MNFPRLIVVVAYLVMSGSYSASAKANALSSASGYNPQVVEQRLKRMESIVEVKFTKEVSEYIKAYLTIGRRTSGIVLGYGKVYLPAIEYNIALDGLPEDLKYIPVIESSLRPYAASTAGAAGLWQIMPSTARVYGLVINDYVDERRDPYRSTEVALKYLQNLYEEFGSWELAMAAYNCGPSKLKQIIRKTNTRDYWKMRQFLPRETANYVPRFIAAMYMMKYGFLHGIVPILKDPQMLNTSAVVVYSELSFNEIKESTATRYRLIHRLNSMYLQGIVPSSDHGHYVTLPKRASKKLSTYLNQRCNERFAETQARIFTYTVKKGDVLANIASKFNCSTDDLKSWNGLHSDRIFTGQKLTIKVALNRA